MVFGNGTGPAATDDVTAFLQDWDYQQTQGNVESWKKGNLNRDGVTNFNDFLLLRNALIANGQGSAALSPSDTLELNGIPGPSTFMLLLSSAVLFTAHARFRRPRIAA